MSKPHSLFTGIRQRLPCLFTIPIDSANKRPPYVLDKSITSPPERVLYKQKQTATRPTRGLATLLVLLRIDIGQAVFFWKGHWTNGRKNEEESPHFWVWTGWIRIICRDQAIQSCELDRW